MQLLQHATPSRTDLFRTQLPANKPIRLSAKFWASRNYATIQRACRYLQLDGFVPVDDVSGQHKGLDVDHVNVSTLCADVQPFALQWQVDVRDPVTRVAIKTQLSTSLHIISGIKNGLQATGMTCLIPLLRPQPLARAAQKTQFGRCLVTAGCCDSTILASSEFATVS
jgi:hypothetical protein